MKRLTALFAMILAAVLAVVGLQTVPAYAYPTTSFSEYSFSSHGHAAGGIIWYNRSVGLKGYVNDDTSPGGHTTVQFFFFAGSTPVHPPNNLPVTRTDYFGGTSTPFNFAMGGPVGGITVVDFQVCTTDPAGGDGCGLIQPYYRP